MGPSPHLFLMRDIPLYTLIPKYDRLGSVMIDAGMRVYLVGGAIRDFLLNRQSYDFDFIVFDDPEDFARRFSDAVGGRLVVLDDEERIYRVVSEGIEYDFSAPKGPDLPSDVRKRDFTINSLAADASISPSPILSLAGGQADLTEGIIRITSDGVFEDDPLRLLRAFRLAAVLDFRIDDETKEMISERHGLIYSVSPERLRDECAKLFSARRSFGVVLSMDETGLLTTIFPQIESMRGVSQNRWHIQDVWGHSLSSLREIEAIMECPERFFPGRGAVIAAYLDGPLGSGWTRGSLLKLIALVHDIGKPETRIIGKDGEAAFYGHENRGAEIFTNVASTILLGKKAVRFGKILIKNHMRLLSLSVSQKVTRRAITRLFRDVGDAVCALLILGLADTMAGRADQERLEQSIRLIDEILTTLDEVSQAVTPLLSGAEIMELAAVGEGKIVGRLKSDLSDAQASGDITSKRRAMTFIKERMKRYGKTL